MGKNIKIWASVFFVCTIFFSQLTKAEVNGETVKLNNLVSQQLSISHGPKKAYETEYFFNNPRPGWVFIASKTDGAASISFKGINNYEPVIVHDKFSEPTVELMYFIKKGKHRVKVKTQDSCSLSLVIRTIPELQFASFNYQPWISSFGPYDLKYIQKNVLDNINCIISSPANLEENKPQIKKWRSQGKRWLVCDHSVGKDTESLDNITAEGVDGTIIDELVKSGLKEDVIPHWQDVVVRLSKKGKLVYPYYGGVIPDNDLAIKLTNTVLKHNQKIAWEVYLKEQPTQKEAAKHITEKTQGQIGNLGKKCTE